MKVNSILKQILDIVRTASMGLPIEANECDGIQECILYTFTPVTNDGIKRQDTIKLKINCFDYIDAVSIQEQLSKVLITKADEKLTQDIMNSVQTGGGELYNHETKLHTIMMIINIISKVR